MKEWAAEPSLPRTPPLPATQLDAVQVEEAAAKSLVTSERERSAVLEKARAAAVAVRRDGLHGGRLCRRTVPRCVSCRPAQPLLHAPLPQDTRRLLAEQRDLQFALAESQEEGEAAKAAQAALEGQVAALTAQVEEQGRQKAQLAEDLQVGRWGAWLPMCGGCSWPAVPRWARPDLTTLAGRPLTAPLPAGRQGCQGGHAPGGGAAAATGEGH